MLTNDLLSCFFNASPLPSCSSRVSLTYSPVFLENESETSELSHLQASSSWPVAEWQRSGRTKEEKQMWENKSGGTKKRKCQFFSLTPPLLFTFIYLQSFVVIDTTAHHQVVVVTFVAILSLGLFALDISRLISLLYY